MILFFKIIYTAFLVWLFCFFGAILESFTINDIKNIWQKPWTIQKQLKRTLGMISVYQLLL
jgi:hypothetical protein